MLGQMVPHLRPRNTLARGVNGKSSGSVSWLDDIAKLTHLVEQGGSRRGNNLCASSINKPRELLETLLWLVSYNVTGNGKRECLKMTSG